VYHLKLIDLSLAEVVILEHILHVNHAVVVFLVHLLIFLSLNWENKVLTDGSRVQPRPLVYHLLTELNIDTVVHRWLA
jgi:hypothetical protein